ncbi:MAG: type III polyketide synthase [Phycisphaerales bacterium]
MSARILGIGLAAPARTMDQDFAAAMATPLCTVTTSQARTLARIYRATRIERRASVVLGVNGTAQDPAAFYTPPASDAERGPSTASRIAEYGIAAPRLATTAAADALARAGVGARGITHLVTASCTGFSAPGFDTDLVRTLGLDASVERTHIGFMGCHAAVNAMRIARAIAISDPRARVLLCCVEICSVHLQYGWDVGRVVANALFADGAGAAVVSSSADSGCACIEATASRLLADDPEAMTWSIGDAGFEMTLAARVPDLIERAIAPWLTDWLGMHGLGAGDVASWAAHPGGPRVLDAVERALALAPGALDTSRAVLREHGNMSSATLLYILDRLLADPASRPCVAAAFGPGLWGEAALLV